jgi:hypothetical protein
MEGPDGPAPRPAGKEPEDTVACRICGKVIPYSKSRLFWVGNGTIRTCSKGNRPHTRSGK